MDQLSPFVHNPPGVCHWLARSYRGFVLFLFFLIYFILGTCPGIFAFPLSNKAKRIRPRPGGVGDLVGYLTVVVVCFLSLLRDSPHITDADVRWKGIRNPNPDNQPLTISSPLTCSTLALQVCEPSSAAASSHQHQQQQQQQQQQRRRRRI